MKQQQAAVELVEDDPVFGRLVARIDRAPNRACAENAKHAGKCGRIVSGENRNLLAGHDARSREPARDAIAELLHLAIAEVASIHGEARRIGAERGTFVQVIDEAHDQHPKWRRVTRRTAPPTIYLIVHSQHRLADQPEAAQLPEQLMMAE